MARELLSARGLEAALKAARADADTRNTRIKVRDGDNLMLIVRPGGGASWVLQYRHAGQRKPLTLGAYPDVTLKLARELAAAARATLARGADPAVERRAASARAVDRGLTVRSMIETWLTKQRISDVYRGNIEAAMAKDVYPRIGARHPRDVSRQDVLDVLRELEKRDALEMLRRVRMWLRQAFEAAIDAGHIDASPVPAGHLKSFMPPKKGHFPAITDPAAVPGLMRALDSWPKPVVRTGLLLSAHLWQRPSELRLARPAEFDLDGGRWIIPADRMKLGREHWVPLTPQVVKILRAHLDVVGEGSEWLFPGLRYGKPLSEATLGAALATMGYKDRHTPHGFRAMARTILEEHLGADPRFLEKQLAHEEADKVKRAYNRAEHWEGRVKMMQQWSDWLEKQARPPG